MTKLFLATLLFAGLFVTVGNGASAAPITTAVNVGEAHAGYTVGQADAGYMQVFYARGRHWRHRRWDRRRRRWRYW